MNATDSATEQFKRLSVLIATNFVDMIGFAIVLPLLPYYALALDATPFEVGVIISAFSAAQIVAAPLWGRVSDRYGRRPALLIGLSASAMAYVVFGLADALWVLFASRVIQGAGGGTTGVAQAYVADTVKPADRARALGWLSAATSAGIMLGPVLGSLATRFGQAAPGFIAAGLCLLNAAFAWRWLPESRARSGGTATRPRRPVWSTAWRVVRSPGEPISRLVWIYGVGMLAFASTTAVLALYLDAEFGITEETIGLVFLYIGALSFVMRSLLLGPIVHRLGETWTVRTGTLVLVLGLVLFPVPGNIWLLAAVMPLTPIATALLFPSTTALMSRTADPEEYGTVMGVAQTFGGLARIAAPLFATAVFQHLGHAWPYLAAGGVAAAVGVLAFQVPVEQATGGQ